nr:hypothetical protein GCM10025732_52790 [Glycomyces mayteni]
MGFALFLLGGTRASGARLTCDAVGLDAKIAAADLVVTGEGSFDAQSLRGKLAAEVASGAAAHGKPCLVMAGRSDLAMLPNDTHPDLVGVHSVTELLGSAKEAMARPVEDSPHSPRKWRRNGRNRYRRTPAAQARHRTPRVISDAVPDSRRFAQGIGTLPMRLGTVDGSNRPGRPGSRTHQRSSK